VAEGVAGSGAGGCEASEGPSGLDCDEAVHQLYHYLDGELTDERRQAIAVHLDACRSCAGAAGFEAELRSVIANRCRDRVPEDLRARIAGAIHEEARRHDHDPAASGGGTP
jgi:mycothiol system anti-sigma-R factor